MVKDNRRICYFVSPHGFGHATRAAAVICALQKMDPKLEVDVVTTAPRTLFDQTVVRPVSYFEYASDVGLVQSTPFVEDLPATLRLLDEVLPFETNEVCSLVERLGVRDCELVVCDIAPLGIAVAREAGVPSLLIENFTWDWIYSEYVEEVPDIVPHIRYLEPIFDSADVRIRAEPFCGDRRCDLAVKPIFREAKLSPARVREQLGISSTEKLVLVTMGGIPAGWFPRGSLGKRTGVMFVVPNSGNSLEIEGNFIRLPAFGDFYHPDIVGAADVVITKLGYSTVAEVYGVGVPVGYVGRPRFRESSILERFVRRHVPVVEIDSESFESHEWDDQLDELLSFTRGQAATDSGAREVAEYVVENIFVC